MLMARDGGMAEQGCQLEAGMLVRVLGTVTARSTPARVWVRLPPQQQLVLSLLVTHRGRSCRIGQLADALWADAPPRTARRLVQALVSRLRAVLGPPDDRGSRVRSLRDGWQLDLPADAVDAERFEHLVAEGQRLAAQGRRDKARHQIDAALMLWRGRPFGELSERPPLVGEVARLTELHVAARELLLRLRLADGEHDVVTAELQRLVVEHSLREPLWALLMESLYRSGRRADALVVYRRVCERLRVSLGTQPGPAVTRIHAMVLRREPLDS